MIAVTGCPRSGTSIMMRTLHDALGESKFIASKWPKKLVGAAKEEKRRDMNPDGFWECQYTMQGVRWHEGIEDTRGKICKIVSQGIAKSNPIYLDKLIVMARNPRSVAKSQERLEREMMPPDNPDGYVVHSPEIFIRSTINLAKWLSIHQTPCIIIDYDQLVSSPSTQLDRVAKFLGEDESQFRGHTIRESLRRSTPQEIENHLWPVADRIFDLLKEGDWNAISKVGADNWSTINREKTTTPCSRLGGEKMIYAECVNCLHNKDTRRVFRDKAERRGIDWKMAPCNYLAHTNPEGALVSPDVTIKSNHWNDTLAPPPPPLTSTALMALRSTARIIGDVAKGHNVLARKDVIARRVAACKACSFREDNTCNACGCNIARAVRFASKECPKGRWKE